MTQSATTNKTINTPKESKRIKTFEQLVITAYKISEDYQYVVSDDVDLLCSDYINLYFSSRNVSNFVERMPTNPKKLIDLLNKSPYEWFVEQNYSTRLTKINIPDEPVLTNFEFNESFNAYLNLLQDKYDDEDLGTSHFRKILIMCRNNPIQEIGQKDYEIVRNFIFEKREGFNGESDLKKEARKRGIESQYIEHLMQHIQCVNPNLTEDYYHCAYCGSPTYKLRNNNSQCQTGNIRCESANRRRVNQLKFINNKTVFWNVDFYRSIIIPTFLEKQIADVVKKELPNATIKWFPNIERDGDLEVQLGKKILRIDAKDYKDRDDLFGYLREVKIKPGTLIVTGDIIDGSLQRAEFTKLGLKLIRIKQLRKYLSDYFEHTQMELDF